MALPVNGYLDNAARTEGEQKTGFDDIRDACAQTVGMGIADQALTIASGAIVPLEGSSQVIAISGEGAADDILDRITTGSNIVTGSHALIYAATPGAQDITVAHETGGSDDITLINAASFVLDAVGKYLLLRWDGTNWLEIDRSWGDNNPNQAAWRTFNGVGTVVTFDQGTTAGASPLQIPTVDDILGKETAWIPATAMFPQTTNGCASLAQVEISANEPELNVLDFDGAGATENAQFTVKFPKSWDSAAIQFRVFWTVNAAVTTDCRWVLESVSRANDEPYAAAFPAGAAVVDTSLNLANDLHVTALTSHTVGGTPADGELVPFRIRRESGNGADTMTQDGRLIGVEIVFVNSALNDD